MSAGGDGPERGGRSRQGEAHLAEAAAGGHDHPAVSGLHCLPALRENPPAGQEPFFFFFKANTNEQSDGFRHITSHHFPPQDDCRVVLAKQEINCLLETLQKQQHQFTELADHVQLDAGIPVTFTKVPTVPTYRHLKQNKTKTSTRRLTDVVLLPGQQSPHRTKDGDPSRDSGAGRSGKDHHPF